MILYSGILKNIILPVGDLIFKRSFTRALINLRKEAGFSEERLKNLQALRLERLLLHASKNSPYYSSLRTPKGNDPVQWLKNFPILSKETLNANAETILTASRSTLNMHNSSGSSGVRATVYLSDKEEDVDRATQMLWWEWAGYQVGDPILQTGISAKRSFMKSLKDFFFRTRFIMAFSHSMTDLEHAMNWAAVRKQPVLAGYASSLNVLARLAAEKKLQVSFKTVISWGDKLFDHYREQIEKTFGAKVYETYGTAEGFKIAAQHDLSYMYIMTNNVFLELLDDNGNEVPDGELGHVVVTSMNGYSMPLIRYRIGDLAIRLPAHLYPKQRKLNFPLLQKVIGRDTDVVKTRSGKFMVVHSFTGIIEHLPEIKQFSVIQENLDEIIIEYIPSPEFNPAVLKTIEEKINMHVNNELAFIFREVEAIQPTKSGKPQIIRSSLPKNQF